MEEMSPGIVRRFWWRTGQRARLALACLGVLAVLAVTGAAGFSGDASPLPSAASAPAATVPRGASFEVTVRTVTDVDRFEGVEADTGRQLTARVAGVSPADCWQSQSRAAAETLLRGKTVRLTVKTESDELVVDVQLPDGTDYARAAVGEGAAFAELTARGELAPVEAEARKARRGLWSTGCNGPADITLVAPSSVPTSSSAPLTTTAPPPVVTTTRQPPKPPIVTIEPPSDEEWLARFVGKRCFPEGARRASPEGTEIVCVRGDRGQLRWQRED